MFSSDDEFVLLQGFESLATAQLARARLESEGIPGLIPGENIIGINPHLPNPGGVKLLVKRGDLMRARALLEASEEETEASGAGEPEDSRQCLKCGSTSVEEDRGTPGRSLPIAIVAAFLAILPLPPRHPLRCKSCGYRWRARA